MQWPFRNFYNLAHSEILFFTTSNKVIWLKKKSTFMHG
jgi:hypothetical protein